MTGKKTVVHVIAGLNTGGAEMMLYKLLSRSGRYDESVLCLGNNLDTPIARKILALGVKISVCGFSKKSANAGSVLKLRKAIKSINPDVIHSWMYHGNVASVLCHKWAPRSRLIWNVRHSLHDIKHETFFIKASIKINRFLSQMPDAVVYNSNTSALQHESFGFASNHSVTLPNGFDCELFSPDAALRKETRGQYSVGDETLALGVVARYHEMKGHRVCLEAAGMLKKEGVDFRLFLIGAGLDKENRPLAQLIRAYEVEEQVTLLGEQGHLESFHRMFDVLISSSLWGEAFSNSIGEAMACAVPCVVTDVGDSASIVGDTGIVVVPADAAALAAGIVKLARLPIAERTALGMKARERVTDLYSIQKVAELYDDLYTTLIQKQPRLK